MADVEKLLSDYIAEHRAGGKADPLEYLEKVEGTDRAELAELIDGYLARSPGRKWDPEAFKGSPAERLTDNLIRAFEGPAGLWPVVLPRLRDRARVKRDDLVARLAAALGAAGKEEKVGAYYHEMEAGLLASKGVRSNVLEALGEIVGASGEFLRRAGEPLGEGVPEDAPGAVFARMARPQSEYAEEVAGEARALPSAAPEEWDEVDELFRGGAD
jgi:hypothetical protein